MLLCRAVSQAEWDDIQLLRRSQNLLTASGGWAMLLNGSGVLRCHQDGYFRGKWFAFTEEAARMWAQQFAEFDGKQYYIVQVEAPEALVTPDMVRPNMDNIGPAVFVEASDLAALTVLTLSPMFG